jgi:hypothetical protein
VTAVARLRIRRDGAERVLDVAAGPFAIADHAVLHLGAAWEVEARGAAVDVDGVAIAPGARAPLPRGARIAVAGWIVVVEQPPPGTRAAGPLRTASVARDLVRDLLSDEADASAPSLTIEAGPSAGQHIPLPPPPSRRVLGRGEDADVVVLDVDLSRHHVAFERDHDGVRVVDLGSKNGTRVGGEPVPAEGRQLRAGDTIACGATRLVFHDPADEYLAALDPPPPIPSPPPIPPPPPSPIPMLLAAAIAILAVVALILLLV